MHHKEIALKVDTAKLILATFPHQCRLVIGGIGPEYQETMQEMMDAITQNPHQCLLLFPDDAAQTCRDLLDTNENDHGDHDDDHDLADSTTVHHKDSVDREWDLIVLDGTWVQARKFCQRYFPQEGGPRKVQLSDEAVQNLDSVPGEEMKSISGHQLRRHAISWRQIGTFEATRLFLKDFDTAIHHQHHGRHPHKTCDADRFWDSIQVYQDIANLAAQRELGPPRVY